MDLPLPSSVAEWKYYWFHFAELLSELRWVENENTFLQFEAFDQDDNRDSIKLIKERSGYTTLIDHFIEGMDLESPRTSDKTFPDIDTLAVWSQELVEKHYPTYAFQIYEASDEIREYILTPSGRRELHP